MGEVVDFVADPFDLVDTGGIDGLTGVTGQEEAARRAADVQAQAGNEAIAFQREALGRFEQRQQPFQEFFFGAQAPGGGPMQIQPGSAAEMLQQNIRQDIAAPSYDGLPQIRDPSSVVSSPLFQALAEDTTRQIMANRALGGLGGSGGTRRAVTENLGLLGAQLGQQQFGQDLARRQQMLGETQQGFANQVAQQQSRFNQLMGLLGNAQSSAAGVGQAGLQTGQNVGGLLTDIAAAQAAGEIGAAGAKAAGRAGLMGLVGQGIGAATAVLSDMRAKTNIQRIGDINGVPWFSFDYIDGEKNQQGTMAQLIEHEYPDAVEDHAGVKYVNYGKLPIWQ